MRTAHQNGYDVADNLLQAFAGVGYFLQPGDKILDYGCGEGALVYRLRELGFDAHGFDIHQRVKFRRNEDKQYFSALFPEGIETSNTLFDGDNFKLPYADKSFDVIISTSVIEHIMDLAPVFAETARILKPDGFVYHLYPNKKLIIEPHIYVPLSTYIHNKYWLLLWSYLGIRNEFQAHLSPRQVAENNAQFFKTGLKYRSRKELASIGKNFFDFVFFVDWLYYPGQSHLSLLKFRIKSLFGQHPIRTYSQRLRMGSLLMRLPVQDSPKK